MIITIKEHDYELKWTFKALIVYENITKKSFNPETSTDVLIFFYSILIANNADVELKFDEFIDWLDENPDAFNKFNLWLNNEALNATNKLPQKKEEKKPSKKKLKDKGNEENF